MLIINSMQIIMNLLNCFRIKNFSANTVPIFIFTLVLDMTSALIFLLKKATEKHLQYEGAGGGRKEKRKPST